MTISSRVIGRAAGLVRPSHPKVSVQRDLQTKVDDGTVLLGDRWYPTAETGPLPVIVMRTPYSRRQMGVVGRLLAERGYQVFVQSCRGTFGSGGSFDPFHHEQADGRATLRWLSEQGWAGHDFGMFGPSYLGITQWAVGVDPPENLKVLAMQVTAANVRDAVVYPGETFSLETGAVWTQQMEYQELGLMRLAWVLLGSKKRLGGVYSHLPLNGADSAAYHHPVPFYQDWLVHEGPGDPYWKTADHSSDPSRVPPAFLLGGWYDIFLSGQIDDFRRLVKAGRVARLTIGPWTHTSPACAAAGIRDGLEAFATHLGGPGSPSKRTAPVRIFVMGSNRWVDLPEWPPPSQPQRWHLGAAGRLTRSLPGDDRPDRYLYDPADPTPGQGGATLDPLRAGPKDQRRRESRNDVLCYTSDPLDDDLTVAGHLRARIWIRASRPNFDVFVRLCVVDPKGRSTNVTDGIVRIRPGHYTTAGDDVVEADVELRPTAQCFRRGHRIRLQVSSGAHPLYARNTGSGEPLATAVTLCPSDQEVFHDGDRPSWVELPVSPI